MPGFSLALTDYVRKDKDQHSYTNQLIPQSDAWLSSTFVNQISRTGKQSERKNRGFCTVEDKQL